MYYYAELSRLRLVASEPRVNRHIEVLIAPVTTGYACSVEGHKDHQEWVHQVLAAFKLRDMPAHGHENGFLSVARIPQDKLPLETLYAIRDALPKSMEYGVTLEFALSSRAKENELPIFLGIDFVSEDTFQEGYALRQAEGKSLVLYIRDGKLERTLPERFWHDFSVAIWKTELCSKISITQEGIHFTLTTGAAENLMVSLLRIAASYPKL